MTLSRSKIPWLVNSDGSPGYTWSPTSGCGPGLPCYERCWARAYHVRYRGGDFSVKLHPSKLDEPLRLRKPSTIGVSLMGDLFHDDVPDEFIHSVFARFSPFHVWILLTKRVERMRTIMRTYAQMFPTLWIGPSVWDQPSADAMIPVLLNTPVAHRFVSLEPQVGAVDLTPYLRPTFVRPDTREPITEDETYESGVWGTRPALDLVIQGAESGPLRRPFDVAWARSVRDQCKAAGVSYYLKQMPGHGCEAGRDCSHSCLDERRLEQCSQRDVVVEKPHLDGLQHLDLPWLTKEAKP